MSTKIDWCDEVWNPTTGCTKGCSYCYAKAFAERMKCNPNEKIAHKYRNGFEPTCHPDSLAIPLKWRRPRRVFVDSMGDLFDPGIPYDFIDKVFKTITFSDRRHTFMILTKHPERMLEYVGRYSPRFIEAYPHLWLGVSVTRQSEADTFIPFLLKTPAAKRFVSIEPMLGAVDLMNLAGPGNCFYQCLVPITGSGDANRPALDWVICGGQTGKKAAKLNGDWVARLRNQCKHVGVPFFFKGWGETDKSLRNHPGRHQIDGKTIREFPI